MKMTVLLFFTIVMKAQKARPMNRNVYWTTAFVNNHGVLKRHFIKRYITFRAPCSSCTVFHCPE